MLQKTSTKDFMVTNNICTLISFVLFSRTFIILIEGFDGGDCTISKLTSKNSTVESLIRIMQEI